MKEEYLSQVKNLESILTWFAMNKKLKKSCGDAWDNLKFADTVEVTFY